MRNRIKHIIFSCAILLSLMMTSFAVVQNPIPTIMQRLIEGIYKKGDVNRFDSITQSEILTYIDPASRNSLANEYWSFTVNTDVEVLVCRDIQQKEVPFWLKENRFTLTKESIKNENVNYEVWRKVFKKGKVNLGINGFDRHRYVYFIVIKPLHADKKLTLKPIWPLEQKFFPLEVGSYIYKDWDELTVTEYTSIFEGSYIMPTYRGRSREAHLINAFRQTDYPSSDVPDQILLSWTGNTKNSQHISWRTGANVQSSTLKYWIRGQKDTLFKKAVVEPLHDVLLSNDPIVNRFFVNIEGLKPNSIYDYQIITDKGKSTVNNFKTASTRDEFEFGWFGDMHNDPGLGHIIPKWNEMFPKANFYLQAGDLVNTGLYRDHWDQLLQVTRAMTNSKPFMTIPGNHDSQEALFPSMYLSYFKFPDNGPSDLPKGLSYHFDYGNTLFLMLDAVTLDTKKQVKWIEETLFNSRQKFKIVVFHFAPHTFESTYPDIVALWEPLFVKYGVDLVFNGHFHYYHRTNDEKRPKYIMSVATKAKGDNIQIKKGEHLAQKGYLYQHVKVNSNELELISVDSVGNIIDQFKLNKK